MTTELTDIDVALKDLVLHDLNARAGSPDTYEDDDIANLAASIDTLGLLNPPIVQRTGKVWGVIAGGRRRAALLHLVNDKDATGWTMRTKIRCRAIPDDAAAATAITVAENVTQKAMDPLDEFEAFARMMEVGGHDPDAIAAMFGVERRRVIERLRYGRIHPDIRAAARAKEITLDAMKAFAEHPDQDVQKATFEALRGQYMQAWTVRAQLKGRGIKLGDPLAQLVAEAYRAAGGEIAADLIEEDSILSDEALVDRLLLERLEAHAEAERARLGFAWSHALRDVDWQVLQAYGRVYPTEIVPEGAAADRCEAIADRLAALDEKRDSEECADLDALEDEYERLNEEYEALTTGWSPDDLARSGVLAYWDRGRIETVEGLVRPEERETSGKPGTSGATGGTEPVSESAESDTLVLSESLKSDLLTERSIVIGSALAANPALAHDLLLFKTIADLLGRFARVSYAFGVTAAQADRPHARKDDMDARATEALAQLFEGLDLAWWDETKPVPHRFEAFRTLDADMKARIVAVALADAIRPCDMTHGEPLLAHVSRQVVPDMRAAWRPTGVAFFGRLKKSVLLGILSRDLHQPEEAARLAAEKKTAVVDYLERLFAAPFATLTAEQREAVETWCPPGMEIETPRILEPIEGDDPLRTPSVDGEDDDPDMDMPEESVDAGEDDAVPAAAA